MRSEANASGVGRERGRVPMVEIFPSAYGNEVKSSEEIGKTQINLQADKSRCEDVIVMETARIYVRQSSRKPTRPEFGCTQTPPGWPKEKAENCRRRCNSAESGLQG